MSGFDVHIEIVFIANVRYWSQVEQSFSSYVLSGIITTLPPNLFWIPPFLSLETSVFNEVVNVCIEFFMAAWA